MTFRPFFLPFWSHLKTLVHFLCTSLLFVADLPDKGPDISGGVPRYNIGDRVNVTCLSRNSMPAAQLAWYVNGEKADDVHLRTYPDETTIDGLKTSRLGLTFKVRAQLYDPNAPLFFRTYMAGFIFVRTVFFPKWKMFTFSRAQSHASTNATRRHEYFR